MAKFFVLYRIPVASMEEWRKSDPAVIAAQSKKLMSEMNAWMSKHAGSFTEAGAPLGKTKIVTSNGITDTKNDLNYYAIVEAESHDAAAKMFADNPHLQIPTSSIEIMEIAHRGM